MTSTSDPLSDDAAFLSAIRSDGELADGWTSEEMRKTVSDEEVVCRSWADDWSISSAYIDLSLGKIGRCQKSLGAHRNLRRSLWTVKWPMTKPVVTSWHRGQCSRPPKVSSVIWTSVSDHFHREPHSQRRTRTELWAPGFSLKTYLRAWPSKTFHPELLAIPPAPPFHPFPPLICLFPLFPPYHPRWNFAIVLILHPYLVAILTSFTSTHTHLTSQFYIVITFTLTSHCSAASNFVIVFTVTHVGNCLYWCV